MMRMNENIKIREEYFGCLIYDQLTHKTYYCNKTGREILDCLGGRNEISRQAIVGHLQERFPNVSRRELQKDMDEFIERLLELGVLCLVGQGTESKTEG